MGWLTGFLADLAAAILARGVEAWAPRIAKGVEARTPRLVRWLIQHATRNLPEDQRERFDEEWQSHVDETTFGELTEAFDFLRASRAMSLQLDYKAAPWRQRRRYVGVAAAVGVVALMTVRELDIRYEASTGRLEELLDQKDRDLQKRIAEVNETKTRLVDLHRQLEAKDANLSQISAANAAEVNEAKAQLVDLHRQLDAKDANLSQISATLATIPSGSALGTFGLMGMTPAANANPTPSLPETPFSNILTASSLTGLPTAASPTPSLPETPFSNILTASSLTGLPTAASPTPSLPETPFSNILTASSLTGLPTAASPTPSPAGSPTATLVALSTPVLSETPFNGILTASSLTGLPTAASPFSSALTARSTP
jgi:hypothetical protein